MYYRVGKSLCCSSAVGLANSFPYVAQMTARLPSSPARDLDATAETFVHFTISSGLRKFPVEGEGFILASRTAAPMSLIPILHANSM